MGMVLRTGMVFLGFCGTGVSCFFRADGGLD